MSEEFTAIIKQLTESLDCKASEIVDKINIPNMTGYWVENEMQSVCEDNHIMMTALTEANDELLVKYKGE